MPSSVGAYLRQLRETRGVPLEEIARATRVSSSYLHALEADDFAALPVPVFTRGFVRAYCQVLGEAPEEALALYEGRAEGTASSVTTASVPAPARPIPSRVTTSASHVTAEAPSRNRGPVLVSFILLVVLGVALFAVTLVLQSGRETAEDRRPGQTTTPSASGSSTASRPIEPPVPVTPRPAEPPVAVATPAGPGAATATGPATGSRPPTGYRLVARAIEPTWMRVRTEEGRTTEETIPAGQIREWFSSRPFTLTIGNAGGVKLELNGRPIPSLGPSGVVIPRVVVPTEAP